VIVSGRIAFQGMSDLGTTTWLSVTGTPERFERIEAIDG